MAKVRAIVRGYIGGVIREPGEKFDWPEGNKMGSWVEPVRFGGKGDHDGDGVDGGTAPVVTRIAVPDGWQGMSVKDRKALADKINGSGKVANGKDADAVIEAYAQAAEQSAEAGAVARQELFADAPAPVRVENDVNAATGGTEPDWVAPGSTPVPADD